GVCCSQNSTVDWSYLMSYWNIKYVDFNELEGEIIVSIDGIRNDDVTIKTASGRTFRMYHSQDCCESVYVSREYGSVDGILNKTVERAVYNTEYYAEASESGTITTFRIYCGDAYLELEWLGTSNGYYSEGVSFCETTNED